MIKEYCAVFEGVVGMFGHKIGAISDVEECLGVQRESF
jgi:hypothetical protein